MSLWCYFGGGGVHCHIVDLSMVVETLFTLLNFAIACPSMRGLLSMLQMFFLDMRDEV